MKYNIIHITEYNYSIPVTMSQHLMHLEPKKTPRQIWYSHNIEISPNPVYKSNRKDIFGNPAMAFSIEEEHTCLNVTAKGQVEVTKNIFPTKSLNWETVRDILKNAETKEDITANMFLYESPLITFDDAIQNYTLESFTKNRELLHAVEELNHRIYTDFSYIPGSTKIGILPPELLRERHGVCQDYAHFMIACLRSIGLSSCYISGYLHTRKSTNSPALVGADATHAWVSVYCPNEGYLEFDPTNDCLPTEEHIIIGKGRDFGDVSPLKGVLTGGGPHTLKVAVTVEDIG